MEEKRISLLGCTDFKEGNTHWNFQESIVKCVFVDYALRSFWEDKFQTTLQTYFN